MASSTPHVQMRLVSLFPGLFKGGCLSSHYFEVIPLFMMISSDLSVWWRLYIYALHGYFSEIAFTAAWEFAVTTKFTLMGTTSLWTMPIYGLSGLVVEKMYLSLKGQMPLLLRGVIYVLWTYSWEFSTGFILRMFGACPWNYQLFTWNYFGLITLEYAPLWYIASLLFDQLLIPYVLHLQWKPVLERHKHS